ncbi:MAG: acetolactate synthase [Proteobacteria bacterium]|nr:acetolactate synthase [Pseudomonadota bacterium]
MTRTAARLLADTLEAHGVDLAFCVPGESYLAVTDALIEHPKIRLIVCRHESGAGFMALADARVRGKPGVCFVSRGPGATNASIAVHTADHDAVPAVFFVGQAERHEMGRKALQEVNWSKTFSDMAKMVIEVNSADLIAEAAARALHVARAGTPGPVVVVMPEDMLEDETEAPVLGPRPLGRTAPRPGDARRAAEMLRRAERPVAIVGGALSGAEALAALTRFAEAWSLPICPSHRRPHLFDGSHPLYGAYLGNRIAPEQVAALKEADLVIALGERLAQSVSQGFKFPRAPKPEQPLIHVWPDANEVGRVWEPALGLACDPHAFIEALMAEDPGEPPAARREWAARLNALHRKLTKWTPASANDGVVLGAVVAAVDQRLAPDAIVTTDAGNFTTFVHRYLKFRQTNMFVGATVGAMGAGVPSVVAAGLASPGRQLVCFVGDGGMLMTGNELATAVQYKVPVKIFVANNSCYGTIRYHQEGRFPGRVTSTYLRNPDFAALAEAFGARGLRIENDGDVGPVVAEAMGHAGPVVVDVRTSLNHISAWKRLDEMPAYR